ncbi:hypothetical protein A0128_13730 [Leptospira tipperaryensis]|uniref:Uncharacterized protein n=1 Tax=Leptospira tipperaryensis TaxID=2564040 RepID=A0A1D7UZ12_9LEPT|nr:hypothetical protein A0128_13730 [Leptospira tipperaryensis]
MFPGSFAKRIQGPFLFYKTNSKFPKFLFLILEKNETAFALYPLLCIKQTSKNGFPFKKFCEASRSKVKRMEAFRECFFIKFPCFENFLTKLNLSLLQ